MTTLRTAFAFALTAACAGAMAQAWKDAYDKALNALKLQDWETARTAFQEAIASRPEDQSAGTVLPGPVTEPVRWRNGAPYSPNFGVAYVTYHQALALPEDQRKGSLQQAAKGFETLIAKNQASGPAVYFLNKVYGALGQPDKQRELESKLNQTDLAAWKVDTEIMTPEEAGDVAAGMPGNYQPPGKTGPGVPGVPPGVDVTVVTPSGETVKGTSLAGRVPVLATKYALVIGNTETQMQTGGFAFAASDAMRVRDALVQNAGYDDRNVDLVQNATSGQILAAATALAQRMPDDATLTIFFAGVGVNVDGHDYLAGIDAAMATDTGKMVSKEALFKLFTPKGARVFFFAEANRPIQNGRYFGMEVPLTGLLSLCQATSPGGEVYGTTTDGKVVGVYAKAFVDTLAAFRINRVQITEFAWNVFKMMQGATVYTTGSGGTSQVPSLPTLRYMGEDSTF